MDLWLHSTFKVNKKYIPMIIVGDCYNGCKHISEIENNVELLVMMFLNEL